MGADTTREHLDKIAEELIPTKGPVKPPRIVSIDLILDGALPELIILYTQGYILNDAEYDGLLKGFGMTIFRYIQDLVVVDASIIVVQQLQLADSLALLSHSDALDNLMLLVPSSLREDILNYAHEDFLDGHQGITRTHEKLHSDFN
ncbi:hypothetical protein PHMEG_00015883 [Phytophthora megakarya]|uniref:Integrase zinc-binding domain-containing protein n=1 Tax=Phytophthora megakarya TaxID=4795 RepID=A0A225W054_9STRA|nr:hypothetical protein PHMEG_00015883 [Phytophthora megakarya]